MKISIICSYPLPKGMAASTRIMSYAKGLVKNGAQVDVFSYVPSGSFYSDSYENSGKMDGIYYCYPLRKERFENKFLHAIEIVVSVFVSLKRIYTFGKLKGYDALIISNDNPLILFSFSLLSSYLNIKSIFIFDEYPIPIRKYLKPYIPNWKMKLYRISLKRINGYMSMTDNLINFYSNIVYKPSILVSSITDIDRFSVESGNDLEVSDQEIRITYMGNMELSKDNVDNIIIAFSYLSKKYENAKLYLYGAPSKEVKKTLLFLINKLDLNTNVIFGFANYEQVPRILKESHILVSSQPNTKRSSGGFPTKLGEYLSSGVPTLVTNVGEISKHVTDNVNIFLAESENPHDFSKKLEYIIVNYSLARQIGMAGKQLIKDNFSNDIAALSMIKFIKNLIDNKNDEHNI